MRPPHPDLEPSAHGLTIWDLDRTFHAGSFGVTTLRALLDRLRLTYAGKMGVQYMHIDNPEERRWLRAAHGAVGESVAARRGDAADGFSKTCSRPKDSSCSSTTASRATSDFRSKAANRCIAMIDELLERAAAADVHECVDRHGASRAAELLANIIGKSMAQMFSEFDGDIDPESIRRPGRREVSPGRERRAANLGGKEITVSVAANPSHLEAVNPVVEGLVRPKQDRLGDRRSRARDPAADPRRRGDGRPGNRGRDAESFADRRLRHRRHHPPGDQ